MPDKPSGGGRYRPADRVRRRADFDRVYQQSWYAADATLVLRGGANGLPHSRLGLTVSRRVGNAVLRNRWKRLLREAFRTLRADLPTGLDIVARPRRGAVPVYGDVTRSLRSLMDRLHRHVERRGRR